MRFGEHTTIPDVLVLGTQVWNSLNDQEREWLQRAVDESVELQRVLWEESIEESYEVVQNAGVEIIHPDKEPFREWLQPMHDEFRENHRRPEDWHEVGIAFPAGHHMDMEMVGNAGTGYAAEVQPDIETIAAKHALQSGRHPRNEIPEIMILLSGESLEIGCVPERHNHDVTGVVWIEVHDDIGMSRAMKDQVLDIIVLFWLGAENARGDARFPTDIAHTPRRPESFHCAGTLCHRNTSTRTQDPSTRFPRHPDPKVPELTG
jgi:hypothetical protein